MEDNREDVKQEDIDKESLKEGEKVKDDRSIGEKIEDTMDDVVIGVQDFFYGKPEDPHDDIPATMPDPDNEIRHINKVQTRRNFNKKYGWKILVGFFVGVPLILGVALAIGFIKALLF